MKISEIVKSKKRSISFEVFPPKVQADYDQLVKTAIEISALKPAFVSVTYGAGGGTSRYTIDIAKEIKEQAGVESIAHLTCISSNKAEIAQRLKELNDSGIENIMALRGDIPENMQPCNRSLLDYNYASDLIQDIQSSGYDFCIGAACYPEIHPESKSRDEDILHLKAKVDLGVSFLTTQMFFDNDIFYGFKDDLLKAGIDIPVFPGIMPITKASQIDRVVKLSGAFLPKDFIAISERFSNDQQSMQQAGIDYAAKQIIDLYENGIQNVHIYTMNNVLLAKKMIENVSDLIK